MKNGGSNRLCSSLRTYIGKEETSAFLALNHENEDEPRGSSCLKYYFDNFNKLHNVRSTK